MKTDIKDILILNPTTGEHTKLNDQEMDQVVKELADMGLVDDFNEAKNEVK